MTVRELATQLKLEVCCGAVIQRVVAEPAGIFLQR